MQVLWVHNFAPVCVASGIFMYILHDRLAEMGVDISVHCTGLLRGIRPFLKQAWQIRRASKQFDIVHVQYGSACGFVGSFAVGRKILWLRGTDIVGTEVGPMIYRAHGLLSRWLTHRSIPAYDKIMVVSNRMKGRVLRKHPNANVEVMPSGIDLKVFRPIDRQEARRRLGEGDDQSPWILFSSLMGTANPIKRASLAMETVRRVQLRRPDAKLKILTGQSHDLVPYWINASDVVLVTSTHEGWPNIVKEGLASHVPFVSTDVSDLKSIADAEPSCTVAPDDPEALAEGVLRAFEAGRPATLRQHVEWMDLDAVSRRVLDIYSEVCGKSAY